MRLIPQPQEVIFHKNKVYDLPEQAFLRGPKEDRRLINAACPVFPCVSSGASDSLYSLCCGNIDCEGSIFKAENTYDYYEITVTQNGLIIKSISAAGLFYGIQTLKQLVHSYGKRIPLLHIRDWASCALRCDHYDLRTIYPLFPHLVEYIKEMASYKINGLLIEYEDKLPFTDLKKLRHPHGLTKEQLSELLQTAYDHFIEIIPLQQTYGHLEYVLKHTEFIHLREQKNHVAELCPMKEESFALICRMLKDIAQMHPQSQYLHLGGDEVWSIGTCDTCKNSGLSSSALFIQFMNRLSEYTIQLGKKPIIWHDMLKDATARELDLLDKRITIAIWIYSGRHMKERAMELVTKFQKAGLNVLGAPSVRCWDDHAAQNYPVVEKRLYNLSQWLEIKKECTLTGIIFTNWSASFSLGNPYGLLETTRYLTFFGNEQAWNPNADQKSYPSRFFALYHGITDETFLADSFSMTDYYQIPRLYLPLCHRNQITAQLLDIMQQYDDALKTGLPLQDMLFRADMFPDNEEIITFLRENYHKNYAVLDTLKPLMQKTLEQLLPRDFIPLYMHSRFFLPELYRREAKKLLKI